MPLDEALPIAKQIAEALEAAHEQGIIHRDLKPANIKVRVDGTVKVLDFGLAKAVEVGADAAGGLSLSPTIMSPPLMSGVGVILGTAAYMAPEQTRGTTVDRRADLWAFGVVLWEMLTGVRLFEGATVSDTLASVLKSEPEWATLPVDTPASINRLLRRCLDKDRRRRLDSAAAARLEIGEALTSADGASPRSAINGPQSPTSYPSRGRRRTLAWAVAAAGVAAAAVALWSPWRAEKPADRPLVRLDVDLGADVSLPAPAKDGSSVAISPDGARLVFVSGTPPKLFTRRLDQSKSTELPGTQEATFPFFSPDGQWIGFVADRKVNKISVEGGAVVPLAGGAGFGASWGEDGSVFIPAGKSLLRIRDNGSPGERVAELRGREITLIPCDVQTRSPRRELVRSGEITT